MGIGCRSHGFTLGWVLRSVRKGRIRLHGDDFFTFRGHKTPAAVIELLRELLAHEQIERVPVPYSASEVLLSLTPLGTALLVEVNGRTSEWLTSRSIRRAGATPCCPDGARHAPAHPSALVNISAAAVIVDDGRTVLTWDENLRCWRLPEYVAIAGEPVDRGLARRIRADFGITVRGLTFRAVIEHAHLDDNHRLRHEVALLFDVDFDGTITASVGSRRVPEADLLELDLYPPAVSQCLTRDPSRIPRWMGWPGHHIGRPHPHQTQGTRDGSCPGAEAS